jgi:hypothetical protein
VPAGTRDVSKQEFSISYDGEALTLAGAHSIDVQTLAPALLAIGKLIREANSEFNDKRSTAKVLVVSDFEHKCFSINFEVVVSLYEQLRLLLGVEHVKTAKEVLEWLGLLGLPSVGGVLSYLGYLTWRNGRKVEEATPLTDADSTGVVEVRVEGDGNAVHVHNHVYKLSENPRALRATRDAFLPLGQDGFDKVRVRDNNGVVVEEIDGPKVEAILKSCNRAIEESKEPPEPEIEITPAWLSVYSPVFDKDASTWRFLLGRGDKVNVDISQTNIAEEALRRGGVAIEDAYQVRLEITTQLDAQGNKKESAYKILEVIRFVPASPPMRQGRLFDGGEQP